MFDDFDWDAESTPLVAIGVVAGIVIAVAFVFGVLKWDRAQATRAFPQFWKKIPRRIWNFYVEAFMIPKYRVEWGKYTEWSFRSPDRPKKSYAFSAILKQHKAEAGTDRRHGILFSNTSRDEGVPDSPYPYPVPHNHQLCERVRINVGGTIYETQVRTLHRFPDTLLGSPSRRIKYYNPSAQEYFFDRNRSTFETILYFYQSGGRLIKPEHIAANILLDDAYFYGLPHSTINEFLLEEGLHPGSDKEILPYSLLLRKVWLLFDHPESSMQAQLVTTLSVFSILLSIAIFCLETIEQYAGWRDYTLNMTSGQTADNYFDAYDLADPYFLTESICSVWFLLEFMARFLSAPDKSEFIKGFLNLIDLVAILPYFILLFVRPALKADDTDEGFGFNKKLRRSHQLSKPAFSFVKIIRLVRVFRIFKLSRYSKGLKILGKTLHASLNELMLLNFFIMIGVILFSSAIYFTELGDSVTPNFESIPHGFWWAVITITTVGYGDAVPTTTMGKVVGALCAVAGVLTIALPVPVIVTNFNYFYHQAVGEQDYTFIRITHVPHCPFRPMDSGTGEVPDGAYSKSRGANNREPEYSSDEEFGELKSRVKRPPCLNIKDHLGRFQPKRQETPPSHSKRKRSSDSSSKDKRTSDPSPKDKRLIDPPTSPLTDIPVAGSLPPPSEAKPNKDTPVPLSKEIPTKEPPPKEIPNKEPPPKVTSNKELPPKESPNKESPPKVTSNKELPPKESPDKESPPKETPIKESPAPPPKEKQAIDPPAPPKEPTNVVRGSPSKTKSTTKPSPSKQAAASTENPKPPPSRLSEDETLESGGSLLDAVGKTHFFRGKETGKK